MILVDFSSILHRKVATAAFDAKPKIINGKFRTSDFSSLMLHYILQDLIDISTSYKHEFGDMVLVMDDWSKQYWRKDVYSDYKSNRTKARTESNINFKEVFEITNELVEILEKFTPWKCITVPKAEADDVILVLARYYNNREKILIHSPDKDLIQAQSNNETVYQYSPLTMKWLVPENKHDSMEHWLLEHILFGDATDNVPKITEHCEFSINFLEHLAKFDIDEKFKNVLHFKYGYEENNNIIKLDKSIKHNILSTFNIYKKNRKGESTILDVYKDVRFGPAGLQKCIQEHGSLDKFLDSNALYRKHYERNKILVLEDGIPDYIRIDSIQAYIDASTNTNRDELEKYLDLNNLNIIKQEFSKILPVIELTAENCGW